MAVAYPLRSRFRTGVTLAMFTLVVFTLVMGAATSGSFISAYDDEREFAGGFEIRADSVAASPVDDMAAARRARPRRSRDRVDAVGEPVGPAGEGAPARHPAEGRVLSGLRLRRHVPRRHDLRVRGHGARLRVGARRLERDARPTPGLAVVDSLVVPRRENFNFGVPPDFRLSGFYLEDGDVRPGPDRRARPADRDEPSG